MVNLYGSSGCLFLSTVVICTSAMALYLYDVIIVTYIHV